MLISTQWIKQYITLDTAPVTLAHRLTLAGLEVEKQTTVGKDTIFELEITPNRPDCLNYIGIAREASAIFNKPLKKPIFRKPCLFKQRCSISIEEKKDCCRYLGVMIKGVQVAPSPQWLKTNLNAVGIRPVNNVVDITNFCLMETGQPMHAFDLDKLAGGKIIVRRAKAGETMVAINDVEYTLDPSILVIADAEKPVAIAGIMGGKDSEVTEQTKNILLESAYFDPALIRRASRKLALRSEASYRFERGVDMDMVEKAAWRAVRLIQEHVSGIPQACTDAYPLKSKKKSKAIVLKKDAVECLLGTKISLACIKTIFTKLECKVVSVKKDSLCLVPASFRQDLQSDVDLIEEIARIRGYDHVPIRLPSIRAANVTTSLNWKFKERLAQACVGLGLNEIISYSMTSPKALERSKQEQDNVVANQNPLNEEQSVLRPSFLTSILDIVSNNFKKGQKDFKCFEIGKVYSFAEEKEMLAIGLTGRRSWDWRQSSDKKVDFYDLTGAVEGILQALKISAYQLLQENKEFFDQGQGVQLWIDQKPAGILGKISQEIVSFWDIKHQDVFFAQLDICALKKARTKNLCYQKISEYPCVVRDISLAVPQGVAFEHIGRCVQECQEGLLQQVNFVEQYLGEKLPEGHRGMTVSLVYQSFNKTLTETEVEQAHQCICQKLIAHLGVVKR